MLPSPPGLGDYYHAGDFRARNPRRKERRFKKKQAAEAEERASSQVDPDKDSDRAAQYHEATGAEASRLIGLTQSTQLLLQKLQGSRAEPKTTPNVEVPAAVTANEATPSGPSLPSHDQATKKSKKSKRRPAYASIPVSASSTRSGGDVFSNPDGATTGWAWPAGPNAVETGDGWGTPSVANLAVNDFDGPPPGFGTSGHAQPTNGAPSSGGRPGANARTGFVRHLNPTELQKALKSGGALRCEFRVNASDRRQAYAGMDGLPADIQIQGLDGQNRAVNGDTVAVEISPQAEWSSRRVTILRGAKAALDTQGTADNPRLDALEDMLSKLGNTPQDFVVDERLKSAGSAAAAKSILIEKLKERPDLRATGRVVAILEPSFRRERMVGALVKEEWEGYSLIPSDPRMPKGRVPPSKVPDRVKAELEAALDSGASEPWVLVSGAIETWRESSHSPDMLVRESLGQAGELEVETQAILEMEGIETGQFGEDVLACLPATPWAISPDIVAERRDLRDVRLFTIDPPTARDLDDALSVQPLGASRWRVGVHIADVSAFVPPGSALDVAAACRATSVYLVQRVIPMLPQLLCEELCSLNPGTDRLAFSVMWDLDGEGQVLAQWTGRTIIRSCAKLAYGAAQRMLVGDFKGTDGEEAPCALEAPHAWPEIVADVLALGGIARKLHARRFANGALRLDNIKLTFKLDADGSPASCQAHEQQEANELVAEFMLLANMSVAQLIGAGFRDKALLRRHQAPEERKMGEIEETAQNLGFDVDCTTAASIQASLLRLRREGEDPIVLDVLQLLITKPMKQAQYFSTGTLSIVGDWRHFALAVPMYTHFTSPIRRYPDVVVHRLLAALLAADPAAATRAFTPAPLGSLEADAAAEGPTERGGGNGTSTAHKPTNDGVHSSPEGSDGVFGTATPTAAAESTLASSSSEEGPSLSRYSAACGEGASSTDCGESAQPADPATATHDAAGVATSDAEAAATEKGCSVVAAPPRGRAAPRLLAKLCRRAGRVTPEVPGRREVGPIVVSPELLESGDLEKVARHCNMRKTSAKLCSEASARLYLCVMLRDRPRLEEAIVTVVNGARFFDLYVPSLGLSERIHVADMLPPAVGQWDAQNRVLSIDRRPGQDADTDAGAGTLAELPCLNGVRNADRLQSSASQGLAQLPLIVKAFASLPVVVSAKTPGPGKPLQSFAVVYLSPAASSS